MSLRAVAEKLPFTYTGADFYALCSDAMLKAVTRQATAVDAKIKAINSRPDAARVVSTANFFDHYATPEDIAVMVTEQDFLDAYRELIPSVSAGELAHYERVRASFEGGRDAGAQGEGQMPGRGASIGLGHRTVSGISRGSGKGKGRVAVGKGKGKAVAQDSDECDDSAHDEPSRINGKGKEKAVAAFHDGADDDADLYE